VFQPNSADCRAAKRAAGLRQALALAVLPWSALCVLLVATQDLQAQQDSTQVSKPKETVIVTGVYEPVPLGEVDRPTTQIDIGHNELVSNSL